jgi:hypothetical protein
MDMRRSRTSTLPDVAPSPRCDAGLARVTEAQDEGENHYFFVERRQPIRGLEGRQR